MLVVWDGLDMQDRNVTLIGSMCCRSVKVDGMF